MSLHVLEPGLCSLIVDGGRPRTRSFGVPCGGPADFSSFALGNALLGNRADAASLEVALVGPVLQALAQVGAVVLGAPVSLGSGRQQIASNRSFTLEANEELHIGSVRNGARAYLCVVGGFQGQRILGSRTSLEPVKRGDELICQQSSVRSRAIHHSFNWPLVPALSEKIQEKSRNVRVLLGPEADWFSANQLRDSVFAVKPESNRMGLRLSGPPFPPAPREMVSQPLAPGTIQVTREGQLILLGVDGQSIGGYPRIAHVISADLDLIGQLRPGDQVNFQPVDLVLAEQLGREKRVLLDHWRLRLREAATAF